VIALSYALLLCGWALASPTPTGPDETAHYVKAVGVAYGQLQGPRVNWPYRLSQPKQQPWFDSLSERFVIPRNLQAKDFQVGYSLFTSPDISYFGAYPVYTYVIPGIAIRLAAHAGVATSASTALLVGRLSDALVAALFIGMAMYLTQAGYSAGIGVMGLMLALTPMAVFVMSILSDSAIETASGIAFLVGLLHLTRTERSKRFAWSLTAVAGVMLALARPLGPLWVLIDVCLAVGLTGKRGTIALVTDQTRKVILTGSALILAVAATVAWERLIQTPPAFVGAQYLTAVGRSILRIPAYVHDAIGNFGWNEVPLPGAVTLPWLLLIGGFLLAALVVGNQRQRATLMGLLFLSFLIIAFGDSYLTTAEGFGLQSRDILCVLVSGPLVAAEILHRNWKGQARARAATVLLLIVGSSICILQLLSFWLNAKYWAVGSDGPLWFLGAARLSPIVGWGIPVILAGTATVGLFVGIVISAIEFAATRSSIDDVSRVAVSN
jgi:Predicted membrane protein (DUF2142)